MVWSLSRNEFWNPWHASHAFIRSAASLSRLEWEMKMRASKAALEAGRDPRSALAKPETLKAICEEWAEREGAGLRTGEGRKATLERLVYPTLGDRPIGDIGRRDIVRLLDRIEDQSGPVMADQTLAFIRRVFSWYASRSDDFRSPIVRVWHEPSPRPAPVSAFLPMMKSATYGPRSARLTYRPAIRPL